MVEFLLILIVAILLFGSAVVLGVVGFALGFLFFVGSCVYFGINPILAAAGLVTLLLTIPVWFAIDDRKMNRLKKRDYSAWVAEVDRRVKKTPKNEGEK